MTLLVAADVTWGVRGRDLVRGVTLSVRGGEVLGVVGPNGAGKSSLVGLLAGLSAPRAGRVTLDGDSLARLAPRDRAARIGYLPQHVTPHWDYGVREILRLGLERGRTVAPPGALDALAGAFRLGPFLDRRWSTLSGGERARTLAASVLAPDPDVILADEPAAALDIGHAAALMRLLRERAAAGAAVAVVVHDLNLAARWCDRLAVMADGALAVEGRPREILRGAVLDQVFGVRFDRVETEYGSLLVL